MVEPFLRHPSDYILSDQKEIVIGFLKKWEEEMGVVSKNLFVRKSGVAIGTIKGTDVIPHHELALSTLISTDIPYVILQKEEALQYLKRQGVFVNSVKQGWTVCVYGDIRIGWIKVLPNRVNNYYPTNWRILKP